MKKIVLSKQAHISVDVLQANGMKPTVIFKNQSGIIYIISQGKAINKVPALYFFVPILEMCYDDRRVYVEQSYIDCLREAASDGQTLYVVDYITDIVALEEDRVC